MLDDKAIDEMCNEARSLLGIEVSLEELRCVYAELVKHGIRRTPKAIAFRYARGAGMQLPDGW